MWCQFKSHRSLHLFVNIGHHLSVNKLGMFIIMHFYFVIKFVQNTVELFGTRYCTYAGNYAIEIGLIRQKYGIRQPKLFQQLCKFKHNFCA